MDCDARDPDYILFGGAFDPPHIGHALVVDRVLEAFAKATVILVPAKVPAGASGKHKSPTASFEDRVSMCQVYWEAGVKTKRIIIDDIERDLPTPNYSIATVKALKARYTPGYWAMVLGRDQIQNLPRWHEPLKIIEEVSLVAVDRGSGENILDSLLGEMADELGVSLVHCGSDVWGWTDRNTWIRILEGTHTDASSSSIRSNLTAALKLGWLGEEVFNLIRNKKLYSLEKE